MASIVELAQTLYQLIESFKGSEFYTVTERKREDQDLIVLSTKMRQGPANFVIGTKNGDERAALMIGLEVYFVKTPVACSIRSGRNDLVMPMKPTMDNSATSTFMWLTTESVIRQTFEEAIVVVKTAKELEKQGLYFAEHWVPWVMKRAWVEDNGLVVPIGKRELKKRIEKVYEERILRRVKKDISRASTLEEIKACIPSEQDFNNGKAIFIKEWVKWRRVPLISKEEE